MFWEKWWSGKCICTHSRYTPYKSL